MPPPDESSSARHVDTVTMAITDISSLYIQELRHLYDAERQLVESLPKVARAASSPKLIEAVQHHFNETTDHVRRLDEIFQDIGHNPTGPECMAMKGLIGEAEGMIEASPKGPIRDAALILGMQKVEHYEISGYGTARTFAELLDKKEHAKLLKATLEEESKADVKLSKLANDEINREALSHSREHQTAR